MTENEIFSNLVRWISTQTGLMVIKAYQSGVMPEKPYIVVNMTGAAEVRDHPQEIILEEFTLDGIIARPVIETEWRFSVHAYGDYAMDKLRILRSAAHVAQANEPLMPNLVIHEVSQVRDLTEFVNNEWETRAQLDIHVRGLTKDGILVDTIESSTINIGREA